jgi:hypothetical protein
MTASSLRQALSADKCLPAQRKIVLQGAFGDAFLVRYNSTYRRFRLESRRRGVRFTFNPNFPYFESPLLSLGDIVKTRTVPFLRNRQVIVRELKKCSNSKIELIDLVSPNHVIHESAHVLANDILDDPIGQSSGDLKTRVFRILLQESFAASAEVLCTIQPLVEIATSSGPELHDSFMRLNSYLYFQPKDISILRRRMTSLGTELVLKLLIFGYLHSNFLYKEIESRRLRKIVDVARNGKALTERQFKNCCEVVEWSLVLDPNFRYHTASLFFNSLGFNKSFESYLNFDPLPYALSARGLNCLDQLVELLIEPNERGRSS